MFKELWRRMPRVAAAISSSTSIFAAAAFSPAARTITASATLAATAIARSEPAAAALAFPAAAALAALAAVAAAGFSVRRRRRIHLHRGGDLLLDGHVAHRNRRRGARLHALCVGLPHEDRLRMGSPHRFRQRCSCRQHRTEF